VTPTSLAECPASIEAARIEHAAELANWFMTGHTYAPGADTLPDRELLGQLLDVLRVTGPDRTNLLAAAAETPDSYRIKRELEAMLAARAKLPDTRPAQLATALGDTECTKCAFKVTTTWKPLQGDSVERTDRLVYNGKVLVSVSVRGPSSTCNACGTSPPEQALELKTYRHGTTSVAIVYRAWMDNIGDSPDMTGWQTRASTIDSRTLYVFVDGKLVEKHPAGAATGSAWYAFDALVPTYLGLLEDGSFIHWPDVPVAAIDYIKTEQARSTARENLEGFNISLWSDASYRAEVARNRALVGI
jgi:hypothetical protein